MPRDEHEVGGDRMSMRSAHRQIVGLLVNRALRATPRSAAQQRYWRAYAERASRIVSANNRCSCSDGYYLDHSSAHACLRPAPALDARRVTRRFKLTDYTCTSMIARGRHHPSPRPPRAAKSRSEH